MPTRKLLEVASQRVILLDGGMGTMLIERGITPSEVPELWNLDNGETILKVHQDYLAAGSEAILTNTFGGSSIKLSERGLGARASEINRAGAEIARKAAGPETWVIGDIGPSGKILGSFGDLKESRLRSSLEQQIGALVEGGVDALIFETQMDLHEAAIGVELAKKLSSLPVIVSFTFSQTKRGYFTLMGNSVEAAIKGALAAGADIVGSNCSLDSHQMKDLVIEISSLSSGPIYAKPNAGRPELINGKVSYAQPIEDFLKSIPDYLAHRVRLLGGCCGTNPNYIEALRQLNEAVVALEKN
jgi:5-methyltetrahydrofolate--homocysteine methyltransferase